MNDEGLREMTQDDQETNTFRGIKVTMAMISRETYHLPLAQTYPLANPFWSNTTSHIVIDANSTTALSETLTTKSMDPVEKPLKHSSLLIPRYCMRSVR
jgi:hypothetical protein